MLALVDRNLSLAAPGRPSAAQREAVADADRRARQLLTLPAYTLKWVHAPDASALACTRYAPVRVFLRDDLEPAACYRVALHELQHVHDDPIITDISNAEAERRAEAFVARATRGDTMEKRCEGCGLKLHNRARFHDACATRERAPASNGHTRGANSPAGATKVCLACGGAVVQQRCFGCGMTYFGL